MTVGLLPFALLAFGIDVQVPFMFYVMGVAFVLAGFAIVGPLEYFASLLKYALFVAIILIAISVFRHMDVPGFIANTIPR